MRDKLRSQGLIEIFMYKHHLIWEAYNEKAQEEFKEKLEQLLHSKGYIHKDDPITAKFRCDECGGTGQTPDFENMRDEVDSVLTGECGCEHCKEMGMVEMTLVVVEDCRDKCQHWDCCDECCAGVLKENIIPLTNTSLAEHPDTSKYEWRKL